jgi:hypothetical protein
VSQVRHTSPASSTHYFPQYINKSAKGRKNILEQSSRQIIEDAINLSTVAHQYPGYGMVQCGSA